jgi:hypothetical protein
LKEKCEKEQDKSKPAAATCIRTAMIISSIKKKKKNARARFGTISGAAAA